VTLLFHREKLLSGANGPGRILSHPLVQFQGVRSPAEIYTLEPRIAPWSVALSVGISLGVGIIFGVYPARRAADMDPIEALRHE